ncbi:hypothetical protein L2E82_51729 [Cichorium intybus]|nr:hypothetical protein L2E82_51729 [Cichorium intybus]
MLLCNRSLIGHQIPSPPLFSSFIIDFKIISKSIRYEQSPDCDRSTSPSVNWAPVTSGDWEVDMAGKSSRRWNRKGAQNASNATEQAVTFPSQVRSLSPSQAMPVYVNCFCDLSHFPKFFKFLLGKIRTMQFACKVFEVMPQLELLWLIADFL